MLKKETKVYVCNGEQSLIMHENFEGDGFCITVSEEIPSNPPVKPFKLYLTKEEGMKLGQEIKDYARLECK